MYKNGFLMIFSYSNKKTRGWKHLFLNILKTLKGKLYSVTLIILKASETMIFFGIIYR